MRITINGSEYPCRHGETIIEVARRNGVHIPTLCYHPGVEPYSVCRLCLVEVREGRRKRLVTACSYPITRDGLEVETDTESVRRNRRLVLELLLARTPQSERVRALAEEYGLTGTRFAIRDPNELCILCGLCERACQLAGAGVITRARRGVERKMTTPFDKPPDECTGCLACAFACPTGAIEASAAGHYLRIAPWGAEVELVPCSVCGRLFAPAAALQHVAQKLGIAPDYLAVCFDCRRQGHGQEVGHLLALMSARPAAASSRSRPQAYEQS